MTIADEKRILRKLIEDMQTHLNQYIDDWKCDNDNHSGLLTQFIISELVVQGVAQIYMAAPHEKEANRLIKASIKEGKDRSQDEKVQ